MGEGRDIGGLGEVSQRREPEGVRHGAQAIGDVTKKAELAEEPIALVGLQPHIARVETREHLVATTHALVEVQAPPNAIIEVNDDRDPQQAGERDVHDTLKNSRRVGEAEGENNKAEQPLLSGKAKKAARVRLYLNRPEALVKIAGTHERSAAQGVEDIRDVREGVDIARDPSINLTQFMAIADAVRELRNLRHGRGPRAGARLDDAQLEPGGDTVTVSR